MKNFLIKAVVAMMATAGFGMAQAASTSGANFIGDLFIGGEVVTLPGPGLSGAMGLSFPTGFIVTGATGDFAAAGISFGDTGDRATFMFDALPVESFITIGDFTTTLTSIVLIDQGSTFLTYTGLGTLSGPGFETTPVQFSFSADGTGDRFAYSSSISSTITVVPLPGALVLFASGLAALGLRRRS